MVFPSLAVLQSLQTTSWCPFNCSLGYVKELKVIPATEEELDHLTFLSVFPTCEGVGYSVTVQLQCNGEFTNLSLTTDK